MFRLHESTFQPFVIVVLRCLIAKAGNDVHLLPLSGPNQNITRYDLAATAISALCPLGTEYHNACRLIKTRTTAAFKSLRRLFLKFFYQLLASSLGIDPTLDSMVTPEVAPPSGSHLIPQPEHNSSSPTFSFATIRRFLIVRQPCSATIRHWPGGPFFAANYQSISPVASNHPLRKHHA